MKTTTAIDFLKSKSKKRQLKEMQELKELIILASDDFLTEDRFTIGWLSETDMMIDIDEIFFDIDGLSLSQWINKHCVVESESDKSIIITSLRH